MSTIVEELPKNVPFSPFFAPVSNVNTPRRGLNASRTGKIFNFYYTMYYVFMYI